MNKEQMIADARESFESGYPHRSKETYTDLECVLLELPKGAYKDTMLQMFWRTVLATLVPPIAPPILGRQLDFIIVNDCETK